MTSAQSYTIYTVHAMELADPERFAALLAAYWACIGDAVIDVHEAIDRAARGETPRGYAMHDVAFRALCASALAEIRSEQRRRDALRDVHARMGAGLLAETRLRDQEHAV